MSDELCFEQLEVHARIGVPEAERAQPQRLLLSIALVPRRDFRALGDDLRQTVDYAAVAEAARAFVAARIVQLLETLADELAGDLLARFPLDEVRIEIRKFILPDAKHVAVRVLRRAPRPA